MPLAAPFLRRPALIGAAILIALFGALAFARQNASADDIIHDADGVAPIDIPVNNYLGNVECGVPVQQDILLAAIRGVAQPGGALAQAVWRGITYQDSSVVTFTAGSFFPPSAEVTITMPTSPANQVTLPANWGASPIFTTSDAVVATIEITPNTPGLGGTAIQFTGTGTNRNGNELVRNTTLLIGWNSDCLESDLTVSKTADQATATPGTVVGYEVTVTNDGPDEAENGSLTFTDVLPAGFKNVKFDTANDPWACSVSGQVNITCTRTGPSAGTHMPVGSETIRYNVTTDPSATPSGGWANHATITVTPTQKQLADPDDTNNVAFALVGIGTPLADIRTSKAIAPVVPRPGEQVTYRIRVRNVGPSTAVNVVMNDQLPAGYTFTGWVGSNPGCNVVAPGTVAPLLTCSKATMLPNSSVTWTFTATTPTGPDGRVRNTASASSSTQDPNPNNNSATESSTLN